MSYKIIGNTEYKSINEKAYINGTQEDIMRLAKELERVGVNYSGRISEYRSAITVEASDRDKAIGIMNNIVRKNENIPNNSEKDIIGNVEYRYIANKRYIKGEADAMLRTADRLTAENISFSGKINGNMVTLTVSGDEMQERVKKYFSEEINREQTIKSVYLLSVASDGYEDGYYISEVNTSTGEEISPYRSSYGDIPMFVSVDEALRYTQNAGIELSNTDNQFAEWRNAEENKENQIISEQLYELAVKEFEVFENSLDTVEKAKKAAYELAVKSDILSYIRSDLSNDIADADTKDACRRLISSGYPLDTFYQDWLKNEYDNRMEAVKMSTADSLKKETKHFKIIENTKEFAHNAELPFRYAPDEEPAEDFDQYSINGSMSIEDYELMHKHMTDAQAENTEKTDELFTTTEQSEQLSFFSNSSENFIDNKESQELFSYQGLQLPEAINNLDFDTIIHPSRTIVKDSEEKSFAEQVDEALNGTASRYNDLKVCDTPQILLDVGCEQLPIFYTQRHLNDAIKPKGNKGESIHHHGLDIEQIKSIPDLLSNPVAIYDSLSRKDSVVVLTSERDKDNSPIIAIIKPDGQAKYNLELVNSNFLLSVYGHDNIENQLNRAIDSDKLLYINKQKSQELFRVLGLQLSKGVNNLDFDTIIHPSRNIVKGSDEKNTEEMTAEVKADKIHNSFEAVIDGHDFSADAIKFLRRTESFMNANGYSEVDTNIFNAPIFQQNYGSISRINEKLFDGKFSDVLEELNRAIKINTEYSLDDRKSDVPQRLPSITCNWSESDAFEDGKTYSVAEFDHIMAKADKERSEGWKAGLEEYGSEENWQEQDKESYYKYLGYDKTSFTINFPNGETITERQDIGDGYGGVIDYCRAFSSLQKYVPILEAQLELEIQEENYTSDKNTEDTSRDKSADSDVSDTAEENSESYYDHNKEKSFAEQVDASLNGSLPFYTSLKVCDTPEILLSVGCEQLPMLYTQKHLRNAVRPIDSKNHQHGLTVEQIKNLPTFLSEPAMIFDSPNRKDSIIVVSTETDIENNPIIISIKPNGHGRYEVEEISSNFITSVYGRNNFPEYFKKIVDNDNLLFCDKQKSQEMLERWGEQYSELTNTLDFDTIIHPSRNIVKYPDEKNKTDYKINDINFGIEGGAKSRFADNVEKVQLNEYALKIGDKIEIADGGLFEVTEITNTENNVKYQLRDLNIDYPIFRVIYETELYEMGFSFAVENDKSIPDKYIEKIKQNEKENLEFAEKLSSLLNDTDPYSAITIGKTPYSLIAVGATPDLDLLIRPDTVRKCMREATADEHGHLLTEEMMKALPDELRNPALILNGSHKGSVVAVTKLKDNEDREIIVSVEFDSFNARQTVNRITSAYGRNNFVAYINREINEKNNLIAINKNKANKMLQSFGLQLPTEETFISFDDSITYTLDNVKYPDEKNKTDYKINDMNFGIEGGAKSRFANNVAAIRLLKTIESENRNATPEEQSILAKYVGWGGIANAFDGRKDDWSKEYNELKSLLTDEEYRAARASTMNAHYTSPTVISAIYDGLKNLGFDGGKILEPAMGTGNFFGTMPDDIHNKSELYGVELDSLTGRIAKQLYPSANIQIKGYEQTNFENNSFDVAVGNVPFGGYKVNDKDFNKHNFLIHDYFFAKTLDKVRPGGIIAFVTSQGTMDKANPEVRKYLAERAELLGAIRLPNNAFKANAGTEVTSDIIFLQKRDRPISIEENTPDWVYRDMLPNGITVNKYFAEHPEMILGEMAEGNKMYGNQNDSSMCVPIEGKNLAEQLNEAIKNISGKYVRSEISIDSSSTEQNTDKIICPPNTPKYSFINYNGALYYHESSDTMEKYEAPTKNIEAIKSMAELRDNTHKLLKLQLENIDGQFDNDILEAQKNLDKSYDKFKNNYGLISSSENKKLFSADNSYHLIKSLEKLDKDGNFIGKADIFSKITVNPQNIIEHCDNAQDALILSLSEKMCVNLEYMSQLTDKSEEELIDELGDKIFQNPQKYMRWESADEYLTGNIRSKLAAAESAGLTRNVEALKSVMPKRIEAADISVKLGSAWVAPEYIKEFIVDTLKPDFVTSKSIDVTYMPATDKWKVDGWQKAYFNVLANETYGTHDINAYEIIESTLNMQKVEIRERVKDDNGNYIRDKNGRYIYELNQQKTMIAQSKQDELKRKFSEWIFSDPDRREKLVEVYNEKFNSVRLREYDGSHLNFVGMNSSITLKEHQKNAVARGLYSNGNTLLAHEVGAGKTFEMIAIAMEGKRLGLHNKPLITAPNGLTEQWGNAFRQLYPNANVLVATEKDFQKENRRDLFAKIATGDWDAVVIGHSQFDMIHLSREREIEMLNSELDHLETALSEMIDENGKRSFSVKQIEKAIKSYQDKIEKLLERTPEDDMLCFEKLGIDKLFVDESQAYKNLDTPTKMRNVSGIGSDGSGRAMQLFMKCKYLDEITGGKGTVFASGTPISNSMSEMYTLMRYLQSDKLKEMDINSFDRWASVFGETVTSMELSPEGNGKYQMKTRFAKFQNLPELMNIFKECADVKTADSLNLDRPDFEMHNVNVPATAIQSMMIKELGERAKEIRNGNVDPTKDNMCKLTVDGRKIGLDQRCIDPNLPDDPNSKVNVCINNVFDIWQRTSTEKSTQLIFCDLATPQPTLNENTYTVYRPDSNNGYSGIYTGKLNDKDTADKIMKKLNGNKPPKNYDGGKINDGDIIMLKRIDYADETAYNTAFEAIDGKLIEIPENKWDKLNHSPTEHFTSERRYCVYDDIKQKLVSKGVPEKEIAFIHDFDKAEDKLKLYDKMNKGEVRVLIGSTTKCGAGMNAQERMIALHDLDAPMRPSDMEQRHGRIIRQGNTNSKVDIYRYTTDKTFDAYLYQMLENKQKFISQIMTDKSPVRSCEDVDEATLDYAEVKALCAGNPLIKEKIDLETEITKLNVIKSAFLSQKYSLEDKAYKTLPEKKSNAEHYIEKLKADIETARSVQPLTNEDGKNYYPVVVNGKEYHNKEEAGNAIRKEIISNGSLMENKEFTIGSYRGFEMNVFIDTHFETAAVKVNLKGMCSHYGDINMDNNVKAGGNIIRLDNVINGIELELKKQEERLQSLDANIKEAQEAAKATFPQENELAEKEKRLAEVNNMLTNSDIQEDEHIEENIQLSSAPKITKSAKQEDVYSFAR